MQVYSDPTRDSDPYALPDVEVFYHEGGSIYDLYEDINEGYYYWFCFPGCLPDSDPIGPFATEDEAIADLRS